MSRCMSWNCEEKVDTIAYFLPSFEESRDSVERQVSFVLSGVDVIMIRIDMRVGNHTKDPLI